MEERDAKLAALGDDCWTVKHHGSALLVVYEDLDSKLWCERWVFTQDHRRHDIGGIIVTLKLSAYAKYSRPTRRHKYTRNPGEYWLANPERHEARGQMAIGLVPFPDTARSLAIEAVRALVTMTPFPPTEGR